MTTTMRKTWLALAGTAAVLLPLDAAWLTQVGPRLYPQALGHLLAPQVEGVAALLFYLLYLVGVVVLAVRPHVADAAARASHLERALLGLVAYGTYDLTNQATLAGWPWHLTAIDLAWGTFLTWAAATAGCRLAHGAWR